jgi:hypothetical protein
MCLWGSERETDIQIDRQTEREVERGGSLVFKSVKLFEYIMFDFVHDTVKAKYT